VNQVLTNHRRSRRDEGFALPGVVFSGILLILFMLVSMTAVLRGATLGRFDQDGKIAMAAAQTGLEDYMSRLNADADYWRLGNTDTTNPAIGAGRPIQGTGGVAGRYRYQVLSTADETARTGIVRLQITGTSRPGAGRPDAVRVLSATLRPRTFLDFAYLSDVEVIDPALTGSDPGCAQYGYGPSSRVGLDCASIIWKAGDKVDGPVHSNDVFTIDSAVDFKSPTTESSWPDIEGAPASSKTWQGAATVLAGNKPVYAPTLPLPEANTELTRYVAPDVDSDGATGPGCYYTGATRIIFQGTTMRVLSPNTSRTDTPDRCLTVASRGVEQVKPIPPVIYVDATTAACTAGALGYPAVGEQVTVGGASDPAWGQTTNYDCHRGTAYVQGNVDSQVTVAGADDVLVTGDLTTDDGGSGNDVIGLIAGGYVWVYHPLNSSGMNLPTYNKVQDIDAAILSLRHSFVVQNWDQGAYLGSLHVLGALSQKLRGPVGANDPTTGQKYGYLKDYQYDTRFKEFQPPYFLKPTANVWRTLTVTDK
jgi:hypothetical protein